MRGEGISGYKRGSMREPCDETSISWIWCLNDHKGDTLQRTRHTLTHVCAYKTCKTSKIWN